MNPSWCEQKSECGCNEKNRENFCKEEFGDMGVCSEYNPKMTGPEAWLKAKDGQGIMLHGSDQHIIIKSTSQKELIFESGFLIAQEVFFEKEWTLVPKTKKVVIDIPEGAKNVFEVYSDGSRVAMSHSVKKIIYDEYMGDD